MMFFSQDEEARRKAEVRRKAQEEAEKQRKAELEAEERVSLP
jgi:hypothetical protein